VIWVFGPQTFVDQVVKLLNNTTAERTETSNQVRWNSN